MNSPSSKILSKQQAKAYFEQHQIYQLLEQISSDLAVKQPSDPRRYIYNMLGRMLGLEEDKGEVYVFDRISSVRLYMECNTVNGKVVNQFSRSSPHAECSKKLLRSWHNDGIVEIEEKFRQVLDGFISPEETDSAPLKSSGSLKAETDEKKPNFGTASVPCDASLRELGGVVDDTSKHEMEQQISNLTHELNVLRQDFARVMLNQMTAIQESSQRTKRGEKKMLDFCFGPSVTATFPLVNQASLANMPQDDSAACNLRIIAISDVSELDSMSHLDGLIRSHMRTNTITVMAGNFLAPSLPSSLDMGRGMVDAMNRVGPHGIQLAILGNREACIPIDELSARIQEFHGTLLNTNLPALSVSPTPPPHSIVEVSSEGHTRRVAFVGLVALDTSLYESPQFLSLGGALHDAQPVLAAFEAARRALIAENGVDLVIPITHQRLADDRAFAASLTEAAEGGIPLIVGGHDAKPSVEEASGCLIVKSGAGGLHASVIDIAWPSPTADGARPAVTAKLHVCSEHPRSAKLDQAIAQQRPLLDAAERASLFDVPQACRPLSTEGIQRQQTTAGTLLATLCCAALGCDGAALDASALLDGQRYPESADTLSYADLRRLIPHDAVVCVVRLPGAVLGTAVAHSRARAPLCAPGFLQLDGGMAFDLDTLQLTRIAGAPVDPSRTYRIAVLLNSLNGTNRNQPLIDWADGGAGSGAPHSSAAQPLKCVLVRMARDRVQLPDANCATVGVAAGDCLDRAQVKERLLRVVGEAAAVPDFMVSNLMSLVDPDNSGNVDSRELNSFLSFADQLDAFKREGSACCLRIICTNDVYELGNLPFLDGVIRAHMRPNTITMLPGDFLAPSLLSSLDKGRGMVDILNRVGGVGIQYVCFGNHENDVPIEEMRKRIAEFNGVWLNTNMPDFIPALPDFKIVEVEAGGQLRRVGLIGLLTVDTNLYRPGAFGGGIDTAFPVIETAARYHKKLMEEHGCDIVIPLTHQVMAEDREMASKRIGFPLLVAAHDHDPYVEEVEGCWIVKTGCDAVHAGIIDIIWPSADTPGEKPDVKVNLVRCCDYQENFDIAERIREHLKVVEQMEQAYLIDIPQSTLLSSTGIRRSESTMAKFLCSLVRDGFRCSVECDGVMMDAGSIRRNCVYPDNYTHLTYGDLKKEIPFDTEMVIVSLPGSVVVEAVKASRSRARKDPPEDWGGYMQLDDGFKWDAETNSLTYINNLPIDTSKVYQIGVILLSLNGMNRNQPLIDWANANAEKIPPEEAARHAKDLIVERCSMEIISRLGNFHEIDVDGDGQLSMNEIKIAMSKFLKRDVSEMEVVNFMDAIDKDKSGSLTREEFELHIQAIKRRL